MIFRVNAIIAYNDGSNDTFTSLFDQTLQKYPEGDYSTQEEELFSWPAFRDVWPDTTLIDPIDVSHIADIAFSVGSMNDDKEIVEGFGGAVYGEGQQIESLEGQDALQTYVEEFEEPPNPPGQAINLLPLNGAEIEVVGETANVDFSWEAGEGATSNDFYYATSNPPPSVGAVPMPTVDVSVAGLGIGIYYWRVDARNDDGATEGVEWGFTVVDAAPPPPI
jgi:hypothetical protein